MRSGIRVRVLTFGAIAALACGVGATAHATEAAAGNGSGRELFQTYCASCHGETGRGNGPAAEALRERPADLTQSSMLNRGVFPSVKLARIIDGRDVVAHDSPEMPVWGDAFRASRERPTEAL